VSSFLDLQAAGEQLDHSGQFGQAEDAGVGDVTDMGDAVEGQEVVLAERLKRDVAGQPFGILQPVAASV
jgi:hypothetical protein